MLCNAEERVSFKTQTTWRQLGELDRAARLWEAYRNLEGPKDGDAKMC